MNKLFEFIKTTNSRLRKKQLRYLFRQKRFEEAHQLATEQSLNLGWLEGHIKECAALTTPLAEYESSQKTIDRLHQIGIDTDDIESEDVLDGLVNIAARKHRCTTSGDVVFEKIYTDRHRDYARSEAHLFNTIDADRLCAPTFYGLYEEDSFLSVFYEFLDIQKMSRAEFLRGKARLASHLWMLSDDGSLGNIDSRPCVIELELSHPKHIKIIKTSCRKLGFSYRAIQDAMALYRESPKFIAHDDLSSGNICRANDRFYLIDWDKWSVSGLGAGLNLSRRELNMPIFQDAISQTAATQGVRRELLLNNLYLFNIAKLSQQRSIDDLEFYLDKLRSLQQRETSLYGRSAAATA